MTDPVTGTIPVGARVRVRKRISGLVKDEGWVTCDRNANLPMFESPYVYPLTVVDEDGREMWYRADQLEVIS